MDKNLFFETTPLHESFLINRPDVCALFCAAIFKNGKLGLLPFYLDRTYNNGTIQKFGINYITTVGQIRMYWFSLTGEFIAKNSFEIPEGYQLRKSLTDNQVNELEFEMKELKELLETLPPIQID